MIESQAFLATDLSILHLVLVLMHEVWLPVLLKKNLWHRTELGLI